MKLNIQKANYLSTTLCVGHILFFSYKVNDYIFQILAKEQFSCSSGNN